MAERVRLGAGYRRVFASSVVSNLGDGVAQVGYPWLASAVTRNPVLVAGVVVAQRLPWLLFTLPAGVITDRVDRRRAMIAMDVLRSGLTVSVATAVLVLGTDLPTPDRVDTIEGTRVGLYAVVATASLLLGCAEVLRDNSAQTILPALVPPEHLERANGRMWSAEMVANEFVGPPLGSALLAGAFALPFLLDAGTFALAAGLMALVAGEFRSTRATGADAAPSWTTDLKEGVRWLWHHDLLRTLAVVLGALNAIGAMQIGTLVLFAQEVLDTSPVQFAVLTMGGAVGAVLGGFVAAPLKRALGSGPTLWLTLVVTVVIPVVVGSTSTWWVVPSAFLFMGLTSVSWNVITVSLRQTIIPDHLLGRVNSVYRFFGWGMMPIGTALGGLVVVLAEGPWDREAALRAPWFASAALAVVTCAYAIPRLTTERMDAARAAAVAEGT
ncbi:MAG TPA: MFS transporter [Iamia sp.]|nr:MFS transporter [Iamia sp.]